MERYKCGTCAGSGRGYKPCDVCKGLGGTLGDCAKCRGTGKIRCASCRGSGETGFFRHRKCSTCFATGTVSCPVCVDLVKMRFPAGKVLASRCNVCDATGKKVCESCEGICSVDVRAGISKLRELQNRFRTESMVDSDLHHREFEGPFKPLTSTQLLTAIRVTESLSRSDAKAHMRPDELTISVPGISYHFCRIGADQFTIRLTGNSGYSYDFGAVLLEEGKV